MSDKITEDELKVEKTEGFKVGEKKTLDEYLKLDEGDESLKTYKKSLGLSKGEPLPVDPNDKRTCVILSLALESEGRPDIVVDCSQPGQLENLKKNPFTIKEGATFRMKVRYRVQGDIISGLKYVQVVKRMGITQKSQEMIGSYAPNTKEQPFYEKKFEPDEAPSGMMARGDYTAVSRFIDDDDKEHLRFEWAFKIKKDW
ncbi:uncharacterized protein PV09_07994 [Verruconis gallopava]|uniref:Rho GDP-dissociation inhibitor n=1 Tax=Verruconis gallopava TaxID=253628 RepID=A0A0D2A2B8_9PEZI|nr:uncharacterized protein PV09_07994 [Verruconis gallopava]KIW00470.1 hypothetical protein PV09_07994 [Verruconis gallopava]